ncbi:type II toxin-antitoxin system RelE/ParE family toxin [soil metagenome]
MKTSLELVIKEEASIEIQDAFDYYEEQQVGLGAYFIKTLYNRLESICKRPASCPLIYNSYRQAVVSKFPFVVVYEIENNTVVVYSVFHTSRDPDTKIK